MLYTQLTGPKILFALIELKEKEKKKKKKLMALATSFWH